MHNNELIANLSLINKSSWYMSSKWGSLRLIGVLTLSKSNFEVDLTFH